MNYSLNTNWLYSKQFKAATATLLLAASMLVMMGLPIAPSAQAATTGTLELSSSQIFGNQTVSMTITDQDIGVEELRGTYNPSVVLQWTNATKTYNVNVTQNTGGSWVAYATDALWVSYSSSCLALNVTASDRGASSGAAYLTPGALGNAANHAAAVLIADFTPGFPPVAKGSNGIATGACADAYIDTGHLANGAPSSRTYSNLTTDITAAGMVSTTNSILNSPMIHGYNMTRGHTMTITYKDASDSTGAAKDVSKTLLYKETKATIYNTEEKQTTVTPGATIRLFLNHNDLNQDPTQAETFLVTNNTNGFKAEIVTSSNATLQNVLNKTMSYAGSGNNHDNAEAGGARNFRLNFTETGPNTGIFKCVNPDATSSLVTSPCIEVERFSFNNTVAGYNSQTNNSGRETAPLARGDWPSGLTWNYTSDNAGSSGWKDGDTFKLSFTPIQNIRYAYNSTTCKADSGVRASCYNSTSVTFTITETSGTMTVSSNDLTSSSDVTVTITDADMNHDPEKVDTINRIFMEINDTTVGTSGVTAKETGANTSIFTFTVRSTIGAYTSGCSISATTYRVTCTQGPLDASGNKFDITYADGIGGTTGSTSTATVTMKTSDATVSTDKTSYDETATEILFTYTDSDADDSSAAKQQVLFNSTRQKHYSSREGTTAGDKTCSGIFIGSTCNAKRLANFSITSINGTNGYTDVRNYSALIMESGINTGSWTLTVTLATLRTGTDGGRGKSGSTLGLTAGDQLVFSVRDAFDSVTKNVTVSIGGTTGSLSFDRVDFPITGDHATSPISRNSSRVNATVTLTDSDKNINANARDNATLRLIVKNATGNNVGHVSGMCNQGTSAAAGDTTICGQIGNYSWYNVTALETGVNTGVFDFKFGIDWGNSNTDFPSFLNYSSPTQEYNALDRMQDMVGGQVCFEWEDGASSTNITTANAGAATNAAKKGVAKCLDIKGHDASISSTITTGKLGDTFTVTATEPDYNRDVAVKDTLYMLMIGTAKQTVPGETDTAKYNSTIALTETGVNTGEFTKTITLEPGKSPFGTTLTANQYLRLRIRDNATSNSFYSGAGLARASSTAAITIQSTTATMEITPTTEIGPDGKIYVKLVDPDLMTTAASSVQLTQVTSNGTGDIEKPYASNGTTSTGTYWFGITMARSTGTPTDEDGTLHVNASDTIYFYYSDTADVSGTLQVVKAQLSVTTESGAITTDKVNYLVGDFAEITVVDLDANTNPDTKQSITVKVVTDSWEIGTSITLQETAADSNTFTGKIEFIATTLGVPSSSQVSATVGDVVTIKYTDTLCDNNKKCTVELVTKIGQALSKTEQVPAGTPEIVDTAGNAFASPSVGDIVIVQASVTNDDDVAHTVTFLVQIKNSGGEVINLGWVRDIELSTDESQTPGLSWLPDSAGTYTAEVYVWTSISEAEALSPVKSVTFTIA